MRGWDGGIFSPMNFVFCQEVNLKIFTFSETYWVSYRKAAKGGSLFIIFFLVSIISLRHEQNLACYTHALFLLVSTGVYTQNINLFVCNYSSFATLTWKYSEFVYR